MYNNCEIKLTFTGNYTFKITSRIAEEIDAVNEDLDGTVILSKDTEDEENSQKDCASGFECDF